MIKCYVSIYAAQMQEKGNFYSQLNAMVDKFPKGVIVMSCQVAPGLSFNAMGSSDNLEYKHVLWRPGLRRTILSRLPFRANLWIPRVRCPWEKHWPQITAQRCLVRSNPGRLWSEVRNVLSSLLFLFVIDEILPYIYVGGIDREPNCRLLWQPMKNFNDF